MWLITTFGFFSIVDKQAGKSAGVFTVRSRVRQDLEKLKSSYLPELTEIVVGGGTDYRYRGTAPKQAVARAFGEAIADIDYSNFKNSVAHRQGHARHDAYAMVWQHLNDDLAAIDHADAASPKAGVPKAGVATPPAKQVLPGAAGGVVFDKLGRLILREPKGHFGHYVWTYGKGQVQSGESHERTALREVLEETGAEAEIVDCIGDFPGAGSVNSDHAFSGNSDHLSAAKIAGDSISSEGKDDRHAQATRDSGAAAGGPHAGRGGDPQRRVRRDGPAGRGRNRGHDGR